MVIIVANLEVMVPFFNTRLDFERVQIELCEDLISKHSNAFYKRLPVDLFGVISGAESWVISEHAVRARLSLVVKWMIIDLVLIVTESTSYSI